MIIIMIISLRPVSNGWRCIFLIKIERNKCSCEICKIMQYTYVQIILILRIDRNIEMNWPLSFYHAWWMLQKWKEVVNRLSPSWAN